MGQLSSPPKKASCVEHVHEQQPCVLLKYTTATAEKPSSSLDETEIDEGRKEAGRDEKKKTSWRFHLFRKRAGKYNLAQAKAASYWKITNHA
ncbi:hypothetical protein ABG768_021909 [Culter alburnus]|uniref:Uncharacterized protein n=1 Tax=Culter alburnus TaxID=194366 RepID=A0AAW2ASH7_CULAL